MKKFLTTLCVLTLALLCILALPTRADAEIMDSGTCGDTVTWKLDDAGTLTISGAGAMYNYYIYDYRPFLDCQDSIVIAVIEDGVTSIGSAAFACCENLIDITIPNSVTSIGSSAFEECSSLEHVTIPDTVTTIADSAFYNCDSLSSITIGSGVTSIGYDAFSCCDNLRDVYFSGTLSRWEELVGDAYQGSFTVHTNSSDTHSGTCGDNLTWTLDTTGTLTISGTGAMTDFAYSYATYERLTPWRNYRSSINKVVIADGVTTVSGYAFADCHTLTTVTLPDSLITISYSAFSDCTSLASITFPNHLTTIGGDAFYGCDSLTSVTIPDSVTGVGLGSFSCCNKLANVTVGNGTTYIGDLAFADCPNLRSITIGSSVTNIGDYAFEDCNALTDVFITDLSAWWKTRFGEYGTGDPRTEAVSMHLLDASGREITQITIDSNTTKIPENGFKQFTNITSVTLPNSVTTIGDYAFSDCEALTDIIIPGSVTSIGSYAFEFCDNLTSITIPDSVMTVGDNAFSNCNRIATVTIGNGVTVIGNNAFDSCDSLASVTIGSSVTTIGDWAFSHCDRLENISLPDSVTTIGFGAFEYCDNLTILTMGHKVNVIGECAFDGCDNLKLVYFKGTEDQWNNIDIRYGYEDLLNADRYYRPSDDIMSISVKAKPEKLSYYVGEELDLTGLELVGNLFNGKTEELITLQLDSISKVNMNTTGKKKITLTLNNMETSFNISVHAGGIATADSATYPESKHKYPNNANSTQAFTYPGAEELVLTFSNDCKTEQYCDYVYIYDGKGNGIKRFSGSFGGSSVTVPGDSFTVKLTSNGAVNDYGYSFSSITARVLKHTYSAGSCTICGAANPVKHTVTFKNWNGTVLDSNVLSHGSKVSAPANPTRPASSAYTYTFKGWNKTVATSCTADTTYTATYTATLRYAPTGVKVTNNATSGKPVVTWTASKGAAKYEIYRSVNGGAYKLLTTTAKTSYTDATAKAGTTCRYRISAVSANAAIQKSAQTAAVKITCKLATPVVTVTHQQANSRNVIKWTKSAGATKYVVQVSVNGGAYKTLTTTSKLTYTHKNVVGGNTYRYRVIAKTATAQSAYSAIKAITAKCPAPGGIKVALVAKKPVITWNAVSGAKKYQVYVATSKTGKYKLLKTVTTRKFSHKSAVKGKTYFYKVRAVDAKGNLGAFSAIKSIRVR